MTLDIGNGGVDNSIKNIMLTDSVSEKLCAAIHSNGYDYWIIVKRPFSTIFHAYLVTCEGIESTPVISNTGSYYTGIGQMKASKDGKCIVSAEPNGHTQLFDFDNTGGIVSFNCIISQSTSKYYYGVEFSPDDAIIYVSNDTVILQYDRFASNIGLTEVILNNDTNESAGPMQLAPDNKIYITNESQPTMSVINDPNNFTNPNIRSTSFSFSAGFMNPTNSLIITGIPSTIPTSAAMYTCAKNAWPGAV